MFARGSTKAPYEKFDDRLGNFSEESRKQFIDRVWPGGHLQQHGDSPLFRHYDRCCNFAFITHLSSAVSGRSNSDIASICEQLESNQSKERILDSVANIVHQDHQDDTCAGHEDEDVAKLLLNIALKTSLMCNVSVGASGPDMNDLGQRQILWNSNDDDIKRVLNGAFPKANKLDGRGVLARTFHGRNLERLGSIRIVWTDNLLDHLRLRDPTQESEPFTLSVFHYAEFLRHHRRSSTIFPEGFVAETLKTLALLFPGHVAGTTTWFKKQAKKDKDLDVTACDCKFLDDESRTLQNFTYWRDRLTILKQAYDESEPTTIFQWWFDWRKRERWATFWVALLILFLTIFFGIIQSIEGALQVYKAYHPTEEA